jgi:hypothetical protein
MQPDKARPVYIRFEYRQVEDRAASIEEGHYVGKDVPFVLVTPPGGNLIFDAPAQEWLDRKRNDEFYEHYLKCFKAWQEGEAEPESGTSIRSWSVASPANVEACKAANIKTVEDLATAPAQAIQRIGMGGVALQQKAQAWLQLAQDRGKTVEEVATLRRDNAEMKGQVEELTKQVEALLAATGQKRPKLTLTKPNEDALPA